MWAVEPTPARKSLEATARPAAAHQDGTLIGGSSQSCGRQQKNGDVGGVGGGSESIRVSALNMHKKQTKSKELSTSISYRSTTYANKFLYISINTCKEPLLVSFDDP
jgi:hypothetical protein